MTDATPAGLKRTLVASTISRLKHVGELEAEGAGVRIQVRILADAAHAAA